ncbi:serine/threonine-protein kinase [Pedobacter sp. JY14-1]|uniref:serine/threonine protein kinase n=1 Tax=Pedobacter sp. JY14-1 TaxID=3034151 RepID=UPI0023E0FFAC|nr:serine/threonine-protein kinase [Pedobacter sp. JY14-1]
MSKVFTIAEGLENMGALRTGGQGSVYKGKRMGAIFTAVKILPTPIHTENADDRNFRNFRNEVEKLKKVNENPCPNVVKILNSGLTESGSFPFIEMEYIEGPDLEELLKAPHDPVFTIRETIKLAEQLANALAHCHSVGVKHGDIKSNNVKFNTATGNYILFDFGLAVMSDEQRRSSIRHAGAVEFMAPEQHDGEMFFQTDIYSYGVILYELLAGTVPFPQTGKGETSRNTVMLAHMEKPLPDLMQLRRVHLPESWTDTQKQQEMKVPGWLLALISRCLEKQPEKRYANGMALQEAIQRNNMEAEKKVAVLEQIVTADRETGATLPAEPEGGIVKVSRPIFFVMILALVVLSLFAGYSIYRSDMDKRQLTAYTDSLSAAGQDTTAETMPEPEPDTANAIKPIITDTAVLKENTEVDSLQKEYERQTAAVSTAKPVIPPPPATTNTATKEKSREVVLTSEGKRYLVPKGILYFYEAPDPSKPRKGVLGLWTSNGFSVVDEQNNFIYVTHTNNDGEVTKGWINKADLKEVP